MKSANLAHPQTLSHSHSGSPISSFNAKAFQYLALMGFLIGIAVPLIAFVLLQGTVTPSEDMGTRLALAFRWMAFPALAIVLGVLAAGTARFKSENRDGSTPAEGSPLNMHRRYLLNTLEQFLYFFIVQMGLATVLPATALHLIPIYAVFFLVARLVFWMGYFRNPAYRSFGLTMMHPNMFLLLYILYRVVTGF